MFKRISLLPFIIIFVITFFNVAGSAQETTTGTPDIHVAQREHDCGDVYQGAKCEHEFKVKNNGQGTLILERVHATCGCTTTIESKKELGAGEEGIIKVTFDTARFTGKRTKSVVVYSNDPDEPELELQITANIKLEVEALPPRLFYGRIHRDDKAEKKVTVRGYMDEPLKIEKVETNSDFIVYEKEENWEGDSKIVVIKVSLSDKTPMGKFIGQLTLYTNSQKQPKLDIFINADVIGDVELSQSRLFYAPFPSGERRTHTITITDKKKTGNLKITKYEDRNGYLDLSLETVTEGQEYRLVCTTKPDIDTSKLASGRFTGTILIETNHPEEKTFTVTYNGYITGQ